MAEAASEPTHEVVGFLAGETCRRLGLARTFPGELRTRPSAVLTKLLPTTWLAWLVSALSPSVAFAPRQFAHGRLCSGFVFLSCSLRRSHCRVQLMPSLPSPSRSGDGSTHFVGK